MKTGTIMAALGMFISVPGATQPPRPAWPDRGYDASCRT
jgi:hypothetical protein